VKQLDAAVFNALTVHPDFGDQVLVFLSAASAYPRGP